MTRKTVSAVELYPMFLEVLKSGGTNEDLAKLSGIPVNQVSMRLSHLRKEMKEKHDVELPSLKRAASANREDALAKFAAELREVQANLAKLDESEGESEESEVDAEA